jgi:hypothetical protein
MTDNYRIHNGAVTEHHLYSERWCSTMGTTSGAGTAYPSGAPEFTVFSGVRVSQF